ncbi:MAG TPA: tetratricopeptide repeat protein [Acidobacteriota bacterium]|nr:tetratricopeptide repeat protein [Acidobacteriota bacterium]HNB73240.1 tetratricopeptide repeat protein [Acidobacteriota bacterium]HNH82353.1 tetratricopeptide repeat protein [Acidobacteriota bacterium]
MDAEVLAQEQHDAKKVDQAQLLIRDGQLDEAAARLREVIAHAPDNHFSRFEIEKKLYIKCWDRAEFEYLVFLQQKTGDDRTLIWIPNAYPRAYYYLSLILMRQNQFQEALEYLENGAAFEPKNPRFLLDKARAHGFLGHPQLAVQLYEQVLAMGVLILPALRAIAFRGKGVQLIELGELDQAEQALKQSLAIEPHNALAANELNHIANLRKSKHPGSLLVAPMPLGTCALCQSSLDTDAGLLPINGLLQHVCSTCFKAEKPKWWQFWK